jgi:hypothetical protein
MVMGRLDIKFSPIHAGICERLNLRLPMRLIFRLPSLPGIASLGRLTFGNEVVGKAAIVDFGCDAP